MATASVTNTFIALTTAEAAKVNTNFTDLVSFLNTDVIHKDASVAFTGVPSGPASNPTTDNQFTRKKYVDDTFMPLAGGAFTAAVEISAAQPYLKFTDTTGGSEDFRILVDANEFTIQHADGSPSDLLRYNYTNQLWDFCNNAETVLASIDAMGLAVGTGAAATFALEVEETGAATVARLWSNEAVATGSDVLNLRCGASGSADNPGNTNRFISFRIGDNTEIDWIRGDGAGGVESSIAIVSDLALKQDWRPADTEECLERVLSMDPISYHLDTTGEWQIGLSANDVEAEAPWAHQPRIYNEDGQIIRYAHVQYEKIIGVLVGAIHALAERVGVDSTADDY